MRGSISVGDKVAYSRAFLRSIACYTGPLPFARGVVKKIVKYSDSFILATIDWGSDDVPVRINVANLCKVGSVGFVD